MLDDPLVDVVVAGNLLRVHGCGTGSMHPVVEKQSLRYILEGSVQCLNNQVRIIIRMVDLTTSHYVWAKTFDRELTDMFTLQDEIATNIITMLHEKRRLSIGSPDGWYLETNDADLLFSEDGIVIE
jgi:TolB-like protein